MKRNIIPRFEAVLEEGSTYCMENLLVAQTDLKYRTCKHKYKLSFMGSTKCIRTEAENIPINHFDFVFFADILHGIGGLNLIGRFQNFGFYCVIDHEAVIKCSTEGHSNEFVISRCYRPCGSERRHQGEGK